MYITCIHMYTCNTEYLWILIHICQLRKYITAMFDVPLFKVTNNQLTHQQAWQPPHPPILRSVVF